MLYPKEDPETHRLNFACRTCQYSEEAASSCVFRNILNNAVGETAGVTQDVGSDPTVSLPSCDFVWAETVCPICAEAGKSGSLVDFLGIFSHLLAEKSKHRSSLGAVLSSMNSLLTYIIVQLPRSNKTCPKCKTEDAVFFQSQQRSAETGMVRRENNSYDRQRNAINLVHQKLFYVCCGCGHIFQ